MDEKESFQDAKGTAHNFGIEFDEFIQRSLKSGVAIERIISACEVVKHDMLHLRDAIRQQRLSSGIVKANGIPTPPGFLRQ